MGFQNIRHISRKARIFGLSTATAAFFAAMPAQAQTAANATPERARAIALEANPGAKVLATELKQKKGDALAWEIEILTPQGAKVELLIDASGSIVKSKASRLKNPAKYQGLAAMAVLTFEQAERAALSAHPGATIFETELEHEKYSGKAVYKVELGGLGFRAIKVYVDAASGDIVMKPQKTK